MKQVNIQICSLIRSSLNLENYSSQNNYDWISLYRASSILGVQGLVFDAIQQMPPELRPERNLLLSWIKLANNLEVQYRLRQSVAQKLSELWQSDEIKAYILKGSSIGQYYPNPSHRYSCDLDIFIGEKWQEACDLLEKRGIILGREVYKEVEFHFDSVYVECHRFIVPVRGNKNLQRFELYLRSLLDSSDVAKQGCLVTPPLMFNVMLYIEHALGDLLHGKLTLRQVVDWMVLRKQDVDWSEVEARCSDFGFDRFLKLIDALASVIAGEASYESLPESYRTVMDGLFDCKPKKKGKRSWFRRRVELFFEIMKSWEMFREFGYCSMGAFLVGAVWGHFVEKEVVLTQKSQK